MVEVKAVTTGRCPSCGNHDRPYAADVSGSWQVVCTACGARGPYSPTKDAALGKWNALSDKAWARH